MAIATNIRTALRGPVPLSALPKELSRRRRIKRHQAWERRHLAELGAAAARLNADARALAPDKLLSSFRTRPNYFFFETDTAAAVETLDGVFTSERERLIAAADSIVSEQRWDLAGFGVLRFEVENMWRRDPFTGFDQGLDHHADITLYTAGGPDIRVLWELNRMGHLVTLALAYRLTGDERFAETFFAHIESWMEQNPYGRGANWSCAMEVALRAINVLAAFDIIRRSAACTPARLLSVLQMMDQHGRFILDNNEFSYILTSNHYLSNVAGLFWIGTCLPELEMAGEWREFALRELHRELGKQILPDGADFESSTGYHNFITEMLLYSVVLARRSGLSDGERFANELTLETLRNMLWYIRLLMRPDKRMPLIGDADGSRIVPMAGRDADDAAYLLSLGSLVLEDGQLNAGGVEPEAIWLFGREGVARLTAMGPEVPISSQAFPDAGSYVMRQDDLYLHFNANGVGANGRGSHAHNDALSIEVSAHGRPFIVDPGSYVYNLDREARQLFRSTRYHSTVEADGLDQNTTDGSMPFVMGNEARPRVLAWETGVDVDRIEAVHYGYRRLKDPVTHGRSVEFDKSRRQWVVTDEFDCRGEHEFVFRLHFAPGIEVGVCEQAGIRAFDRTTGKGLLVRPLDCDVPGFLEKAFVSRNYGHKEPSTIAGWRIVSKAGRYRWSIAADKP